MLIYLLANYILVGFILNNVYRFDSVHITMTQSNPDLPTIMEAYSQTNTFYILQFRKMLFFSFESNANLTFKEHE